MWSHIYGHRRQIDQLKKALTTGKIPNAYLFCGLKGIGKGTTALAFAQALFCGKSPEACGVCVSCVKIKNRQHPDVFFVEAKTSKILIEQIRQLKQDLQFHPLEGSYKLAIIDDAETMTESAANSLLKMLEEPPPRTFFILISSLPHRLLPTIRSRCRQIVFPPLTKEEVKSYLQKQLETGEKNSDRLAAISQGSIGSVSALDEKFMEDVLDRFRSIMGNANAADIISLASVWSEEEDRVLLILDLLAGFYRDILCDRIAGPGTRNAGASGISGIAPSNLKKRPVARLEADFLSIMKARDVLAGTAANKQLLFEQLLFTLTG
jgi:DNA polymerase-3 subunit delta'